MNDENLANRLETNPHDGISEAVQAETYRDMSKIAVETLGYESILEALEATPPANILGWLVETLKESNLPPLPKEHEELAVNIANRAVELNLVDGNPKYDSAQGYACALAAVKLAFAHCNYPPKQ